MRAKNWSRAWVLAAKVIHTPVDNSPKAVDNSKKVV
jgi:hypothetical protein